MLHQLHEFTLHRVDSTEIDDEGVVALDRVEIPGLMGHFAQLSSVEQVRAQSFAQGATAILRVDLGIEVRASDRIEPGSDDWFSGLWEVASVGHTPKHQRIFLRRTEFGDG